MGDQTHTSTSNVLTLDAFPFLNIARGLCDGDVVPFIGAGASLAGVDAAIALPTGQALARELIGQMEGRYPEDAPPDLARVAQYFETYLDRPTLYELLHERFVAQQRERDPARVATLLAELPNRTRPLYMITTNYDTFVERAFEAAKRPLCVITQNARDPEAGVAKVRVRLPSGETVTDTSNLWQWSDPKLFPSDCAYLLKMHGSADRQVLDGPDDLIVTEDDYIDFMVQIGGSIAPFIPPASLTAVYKQRRFLFLGYSLYDWNFRAFLRILTLQHAISRQKTKRHFAVQLDPVPIEAELWEHRNVNVYGGDLSEFCERLCRQLTCP